MNQKKLQRQDNQSTETISKRYVFQKFITIRSSGTEIYKGFITLNEKTEKLK